LRGFLPSEEHEDWSRTRFALKETPSMWPPTSTSTRCAKTF
jgi:hypothetical protein